MIDKKHLAVFASPDAPQQDSAPLPELSGVLYSQENADGSQKMCANCVLWCASDEMCSVHSMDVVAPPNAVCGRHVFGPPQPGAYIVRPGMVPARPELSGLVQVAGGASCAQCRWYTPSSQSIGTCSAVLADGRTAVVHTRARCARWEHV